MSIKNIPIFAKILLLMSAFAVLTLVSAVFSTSKIQEIGRSYADLLAHESKATMNMARVNRAAYATYAAIGELVISNSEEGNKVAVGHFTQGRSDALSFVENISALGSGYVQAAERIKKDLLQVIDKECGNTVRLGQSTSADDAPKALAAFRTECQTEFLPLSKRISAETNTISSAQEKVEADLDRRTHDTVLMTYCLVIGGTTLLILAAFFAVRAWISRPVRNLTGVMESLAHGDNTVVIPGADRRDEVGAMARTVQVFKEVALDKLRIEAAAAVTERQAEEQRAADDAARAEHASDVAKVVESLADGLGHISEGDLCIRLNDQFAPEYERLRIDFNTAVEQMQGALGSIVAGFGTIRSGTGEISQAAEDLSRRTEQQAASLEETAAALEQITTTVKRAAEGASHARTVVSKTRADAEQSGLVVENAVNAMGEIEKSSQQISQIISVIDEIAFQTNLLALNAGVEAARAGDAGRGFAVVASEVRALAQRSAEAAREIKALISSSTKQVGAGVKLVGETGTALKRIVVQVGEVDAVVSEIAASAKEQATGLAQVNIAVNEMDQVTQQNAAMVEQSTAATRALAHETEALAKLTDHFSLGQEAKAQAAEPRHRPSTSRPAHAEAPAKGKVVEFQTSARGRPAHAAEPSRRAKSAGGTSPAARDESWEEF